MLPPADVYLVKLLYKGWPFVNFVSLRYPSNHLDGTRLLRNCGIGWIYVIAYRWQIHRHYDFFVILCNKLLGNQRPCKFPNHLTLEKTL
jgi:hypothetical protein